MKVGIIMKNKINYEEELRDLEFARKDFDEIIALLKYKNDNMIELNKSRLIGDIDLVMSTLEELKQQAK